MWITLEMLLAVCLWSLAPSKASSVMLRYVFLCPLQLRFHSSMKEWWKNKEKVSGPWKNKALFLFFSLIWKQRNFFPCSSTVFPWKNRNPVAVVVMPSLSDLCKQRDFSRQMHDLTVSNRSLTTMVSMQSAQLTQMEQMLCHRMTKSPNLFSFFLLLFLIFYLPLLITLRQTGAYA